MSDGREEREEQEKRREWEREKRRADDDRIPDDDDWVPERYDSKAVGTLMAADTASAVEAAARCWRNRGSGRGGALWSPLPRPLGRIAGSIAAR